MNTVNKKKEEDERILAIILPVFEYHKSRYGYRRIMMACEELKGVNHKKIRRIMSQNGLFGRQPKNKYHSYKGDNGEYKENLLLHKEVDEGKHKTKYVRDFTTSKPNEK